MFVYPILLSHYHHQLCLPVDNFDSMSYNSREWDRGKDSWGDYSSWQDSSRGHFRPQDDEYYADGKRRKYNNGVSLQHI
jgi:hypothetical protein